MSAETDKIVESLSKGIEAATVKAAVAMIDIELSRSDVLNSKVACDSLKRARQNIGGLCR